MEILLITIPIIIFVILPVWSVTKTIQINANKILAEQDKQKKLLEEIKSKIMQ